MSAEENIAELETLVAPPADFGARNYRPYNRGNKLKRVVEESTMSTDKPSLLPMASIHDQFEFSHIGKKRAILSKVLSRKEHGDDLTLARHLIEDDPYVDVHIDDAWAIPETLDQVKSIDSMVYSLRNRELRVHTQTALEIIEEEAAFLRNLSRISDMLNFPDVSAKESIHFEDVDTELLDDVKDNVQQVLNATQEYLNQLSQMRGKVMVAYLKKKKISKLVAPFSDSSLSC